LANIKQSKKRAVQDVKKRNLNKSKLSAVKTYIKKFLRLIISGDFNKASNNFSFLTSVIDKSVTKGIFKKGKANRLKHRLNLKLKLIKPN